MARRDRDARKVDQALDLLQGYIQQVKNEYEMYFMGIQKRPPTEKQRDLKRMIRELMELGIQNTAQRFKLRVLRSRFNTLNVHWQKTVKQIEDGTYKKHRFMADKRAGGEAMHNAIAAGRDVKAEIRALVRGEEVPESGPPAEAPADAAPRGRPAGRRPPRAPAGGGGHAVGSNDLVAEYSAVRKKLGMEGRVNASALEARLRKHAEIIKERTGAREVRFKVVAEDGKPKLKAIPVKK